MGLFGGAGALGAAVAPAVGITYSRGWMYIVYEEPGIHQQLQHSRLHNAHGM